MSVEFTNEQIDHICYQIGEWYLDWERKMWVDGKPNQHWLGVAKEQLKEMICGNEYTDNSDILKNELFNQKEIAKILVNVMMLLGIIHGNITAILASPEHEMKSKLDKLWHKLAKEIGLIFCKEPATSTP